MSFSSQPYLKCFLCYIIWCNWSLQHPHSGNLCANGSMVGVVLWSGSSVPVCCVSVGKHCKL